MSTETGLVEIIVSPERLQAWARVNGGVDPQSFDEPKVLELLVSQSLEVTEDVRQRVHDLAERLSRGELSGQDVLLAEGTKPVPGEDGCVRWEARFDPQQIGDAAEEDANAVDYYARSSIVTVSEGELICTVVPPTEGVPGRDIYGNETPAPRGRRATMSFGDSIVPDGDSGRMTAKIGGKLNIAGRNAWISPLLTVNRNVDFRVGNIDFDGDVLIQGNVLDLFQVRASGSMVVLGVIEGAKIECGGDLTVAGGIAGKEKAVLSVGGKLRARFIDNCAVSARGTVLVHRELVNSKVSTDGRVVTSGGITACTIEASAGIEASQIGSKAGVRTTLCVGSNAEVHRRLNRVERELGAIEEGIIQSRARLEPLLQRQQALPATHKTVAMKILTQIKEDMAQTAELKKEKERVQQLIQSYRDACIRVSQLIHEGTTVQIGKVNVTLRQSLRGPLQLVTQHTAQGDRLAACTNTGGMIVLE